jgi:hypothetical protein
MGENKMIYVTNDPNYDSESEKQHADASVERVGEITQEPATNEAVDTNEASKIANLLQGLRFPSTNEQIKEYIADGKSITISDENARYTSQYIEESLQDGKTYNSTYEIEKALGLVIADENGSNDGVKKGDEEEMKPYARDKALNEANKRRFGEKIRPDPYNTAKHDTEKES